MLHSPPISPRALVHRVVTNPDGSQVDVEDNTLLANLDKEHILANMRNRFLRDCIYTYTASVLLAVNPYKHLPNLYGPEMQLLYTNKSLHSMPPHPYAIADTAFRYFQGEGGKSQVLVVSGESGSGKTETAKVLISFLANHRDRRDAVRLREAAKTVATTEEQVHDRVISATPILEAFGNASTIRNKNSSRFGKYHRLLYDKTGRLNGAEIKPLLLESSRVTGVGPQERNFHVFYLLLGGMEKQELKDRFGLEKTGKYPLVSNGAKHEHSQEDVVRFAELLDAFKTVGFSENEMYNAFSVVSGLLVLSQVEFGELGVEGKDEEGNAVKGVEICNQEVFERASHLLGIDQIQLQKVLVNKTVKISNRKSAYSVSRSLGQVEATRATLIRTIYKRLFEAIVDRINELVAATQTARDASSGLHIGVLDIFGFENLERNSFEQLCINLTNEKLQEFFIRKVLEAEQKTYQAEGIQSSSNDVMKIPLPDCSETLSSIKGALELLDDHCIKLSRGMPTDEEKYCIQVQRKFSSGKKLMVPKLEKAKRTEGGKVAPRAKTSEAFIIKHYAGEVQYSVAGWLDKNNERMSPEMECLLRDSSGGEWVSKLADKEACSYACEKFKSVRFKFMTELDHLLQMLDKCSVHYIRCFNPNSFQKSGDFNTNYVQEQVVQCGTVELVNVMHHGFPNRQPLTTIAENFQHLLPHDFRSLNSRDFTSVIMNAFEVPETEYAIGFTTLFLKADQVRLLEQLRGCGELPSERILSTIRRQVADKKLKRCLGVIRLAVWLPKLMREIRRKNLFSLGAKLALTLAFLIPRTKSWLATARYNIILKKEEEERLRLIEEERLRLIEEERVRLIEEERLRLIEEERVRLIEEERLRLIEEERVRLIEEERLRLIEEERLRLIEEERLKLIEEERLRSMEEERLRLIRVEEERVRRIGEEKARLVEEKRVRLLEQKRSEEKRVEERRVEEKRSEEKRADPNGKWISDEPVRSKNLKVTPSTRTVPQLPPSGNEGKENMITTQSNIAANSFFPPHAYGPLLTKTTSSLAANSLAKLPPITAMMASNVELFSIPRLQALLIYDGQRILPLSTNETAAMDPKSRRSSLGSNLPTLLPPSLRNSSSSCIGAIAQHPSKPELFATTETDEVGAITIWKACRGVESRFRIHLGTPGSPSVQGNQTTSIIKMCFISPDSSPDMSSCPALFGPNSHLLAALVECRTPSAQQASQFLIIVEVSIASSSSNSSSSLSYHRKDSSESSSLTQHQFKVHKVESIPPSQFVSNLNRKISFLKSSASGRIVAVGGKGLLMFFAVGVDSSGTIQVDMLAEQSYFPQIQSATFLSFISLYQVDPAAPRDPAEYIEEQLIVTSADGNMLRFPILVNEATCALDISGCGKVKECLVTLSGKRITSLVKRSDDAYFTITADGCIDQWVWVERRPFRDQESSIALVAENSKAMFSTAALLTREVVCFDASAGKVVAFDPTDPDSLNPRLLYQFNSQGVLA